MLTADEIIATLAREIGRWKRFPIATPALPRRNIVSPTAVGRVGFIASVTRPFCLNCNRLRLTADGKLRYCLFAIEETDVRALLRDGAPDEAIARAIRETVQREMDRPRDQLRAVRGSAAADVLDRRLGGVPFHESKDRAP